MRPWVHRESQATIRKACVYPRVKCQQTIDAFTFDASREPMLHNLPMCSADDFVVKITIDVEGRGCDATSVGSHPVAIGDSAFEPAHRDASVLMV